MCFDLINNYFILLTFRLNVPDGDVLIHGGDFSNVGHERDVQHFRTFIDSLSHPHKVR